MAYAMHGRWSRSFREWWRIHHMPGWDEWTREVVRNFAYHGYAAIAPHL